MGEMRNSSIILAGKYSEKRKLDRPRCRWQDIDIDLKKTV
jgi:hypothetical protein